MKITDSWYLCFRLFKKEFSFYFVVLVIGVITIGTIMVSTDLYRSFVTENFASKQPHFSLSFLSESQRKQQTKLIQDIQQLEGVVAVSPYAKSVSWGQFSASTTQRHISGSGSFDKFSSGYFTVIGVDKASPSIVSWEMLNFYAAGEYKTKITNLEFEYEWVVNPRLVVPNAVFDSSFYPPISQEARIKNQFSDKNWQVKGFIQDHHDDARLYVSKENFSDWLAGQNSVTEQGVFVRMKEHFPLPQLRSSLELLCDKSCTVTAWLDQHERKSKVLTVFETFSWVTSLTISVLVCFLVGLYQAKSIIDKSRTINILHITGYSFNNTVASIVITITSFAFLFFWLYMEIIFPEIAAWLNSNYAASPYVLIVAGSFCILSSLFSMGVFHFAINKV